MTNEITLELCCRNLSHPINVRALGSNEMAHLLVFWLQTALPEGMSTFFYDGKIDDCECRRKILVTDDDVLDMRSGWNK